MRVVRLLAAAIALCAWVVLGTGTVMAEPSDSTASVRDSLHGFDFLMGTWSMHFRKLVHPLSGSHEWIDFEGTSTVRPLWDGRGNTEEGVMDMPAPRGREHVLTVRLYNEKTHQWSLYIGGDTMGILMPPQVGQFDASGVGQFLADDTFQNKKIIIRYKWMPKDADHCRFEQSFSADDGKTWETNWTTDYTRIK